MYSKIVSGVAIVLALVLTMTSLRVSSLSNRVEELSNQPQIVSTDRAFIELPDMSQYYSLFENSTMTYLNRLNEMETEQISSYVPPEGSITTIAVQDSSVIAQIEELNRRILELQSLNLSHKDSLELDSLKLKADSLYWHVTKIQTTVDDSGWCLTPAVGVGYRMFTSDDISIGSRIFFYRRLGIGPFASVSVLSDEPLENTLGGGVIIDYRIPSLDNVGLKGFVLIKTNGDVSGGVGLNFLLR